MAKEAWLLVFGQLVGRIVGAGSTGSAQDIPVWSSFGEGRLPVVLVDNGPFTAAAVAYSEAEYGVLTSLGDSRPRLIYSVVVEDLRGVSDVDRYLGEG
jgi:hypothetical protein